MNSNRHEKSIRLLLRRRMYLKLFQTNSMEFSNGYRSTAKRPNRSWKNFDPIPRKGGLPDIGRLMVPARANWRILGTPHIFGLGKTERSTRGLQGVKADL